MKKLEALTFSIYGNTIKVKIGEYDRIKKTLFVKKYRYYEGTEAKFIKEISVNEIIKFTWPDLYKTKFEHEELNKYYVIVEEKTQ